MKKIGILIKQKEKSPSLSLDDKTIFFLFGKIIKEEYGSKGSKNLKPDFFKNGKIFVKSESSVFANELLLNKNEIIRKINQEIGNKEIQDIKVN